ncbi:small multidrug efflux protein [Occultella gossypii]|uniref:Small multidrug efflux protein n=1 Tax=Occultella gossypii TaxID=2800820 RepID=A0ABS7SCX4_9MICO|nr:small multidrug efflux protein [Occultella gossypii]MBZ2198209.1 small multidrug efflux protein [Occultella gossypii]
MSPIEQLISNFQELVAHVPEIVQPFIIMLAGAIPFIDGEGAALIGIAGGVHPIVAGVAAATGNFLCVLLVVALTSRARTAIVDRRPSPVGVSGGSGARPSVDGAAFQETATANPESKGRQRFNRWLVRFGVPGASILGPLAIPTQITSAILVGGGTPRRWVLLWQAIAIVIWTSIGTVAAWAALTIVVGVS